MPPDFNKLIFEIQISICQSSFLVIVGEVEINGPPVRSTNFEKKGQDGTDGKKSFFSNRPSVPSSTFAHKLLDGTAGFGAPKVKIFEAVFFPRFSDRGQIFFRGSNRPAANPQTQLLPGRITPLNENPSLIALGKNLSSIGKI